MKEYGFSKADRIKSSNEISAVRKLGSYYKTEKAVLVVAGVEGNDSARFGINLTRGFKTAVERNRVKRIIRELFRHRKTDFPKTCLVLAIADSSLSELNNAEIRFELESLLATYKANANRTISPKII